LRTATSLPKGRGTGQDRHAGHLRVCPPPSSIASCTTATWSRSTAGATGCASSRDSQMAEILPDRGYYPHTPCPVRDRRSESLSEPRLLGDAARDGASAEITPPLPPRPHLPRPEDLPGRGRLPLHPPTGALPRPLEIAAPFPQSTGHGGYSPRVSDLKMNPRPTGTGHPGDRYGNLGVPTTVLDRAPVRAGGRPRAKDVLG
jgi:hypothetical protein